MLGQVDLVVSLLAEGPEWMAGLRSISRLLCELEVPHEMLCGRAGAVEDLVRYARSSQRRGIRVIVASGRPDGRFAASLIASTLVPVLTVEEASAAETRSANGSDDQALRTVLTIGSILTLDDTRAQAALEAFRREHGVEAESLVCC